ncbi:P-loop containing nucleoside triphosphate hydrolase protein [Atractiella rhizophila]|nr:P-loop containing nucleoside triphosphate hydrolase protein [Atractiella rhizophila]
MNGQRAPPPKHFWETISAKDPPIFTNRSAKQFLDSMIALKPDLYADAIQRLKSSTHGLSALQQAMRTDTDVSFFNAHGRRTLSFLQHPSLVNVSKGRFLDEVLLAIVEPSIFWDPFVEAFKARKLLSETEQCFAWLLLGLVSLPVEKAKKYIDLFQRDSVLQKSIENSQSGEVRNLGQKIKKIISTRLSPSASAALAKDRDYPGGRHDNDFEQFSEVSILPTMDELLCKEPPFLRMTSELADEDYRDCLTAVHLDNQFRLLREDMLGELRLEIQIALGEAKGRHRGLVIDGLELLQDLFFGKDPAKRIPWCIQLRAPEPFGPLRKEKGEKKRKAYLADNKKFLRHQSVACLIVDRQCVGFGTIHRDEEDLAKDQPIIITRLVGGGVKKTLAKLLGAKIKLCVLDTAIFAYEPVLRALQDIKTIYLADELFSWSPSRPVGTVSHCDHLDETIKLLEKMRNRNIGRIVGSKTEVVLDDAQHESLLAGLKQSVSLIQGPPGTGKSFIGSLLLKILYQHTNARILVVTYTNHALDQFLDDILNRGVDPTDVIRLGGKAPLRHEAMTMFRQNPYKLAKSSWNSITEYRSKGEASLVAVNSLFQQVWWRPRQEAQAKGPTQHYSKILRYLEYSDAAYFDAFDVQSFLDEADGFNITSKGKNLSEWYLIERWWWGKDAGVLVAGMPEESRQIWGMTKDDRRKRCDMWVEDIVKDAISTMAEAGDKFDKHQVAIEHLKNGRERLVFGEKRIICATTTGAAKSDLLEFACPDVLLVEEAGEILESHVLTALGATTRQMILIGDHQQLRPKIANYSLSVEKGAGYDLNRSTFERLVVLQQYPHQQLTIQYRMRPEISKLIRTLTYPNLVDGKGTSGRATLPGFQSNNGLLFVNHEQPEEDETRIGEQRDGGAISSKRNQHEVDLVVSLVKYLCQQQGIESKNITVLTPYLGQLYLLRNAFLHSNDAVLSDLDSHDLLRGGLIPNAVAKRDKKPLRLSTIDNYQGEENDIIIVSLTRSNARGDVGFLTAPERVNVLLSRARNALIMIGNFETFEKNKRGGDLWKQLLDMARGSLYDGFPVQCERHPRRKALLKVQRDFEESCPDGGCTEPCGESLSCGQHTCPQKCHRPRDHGPMPCQVTISLKCNRGHDLTRTCSDMSVKPCKRCYAEDKKKEREAEEERDRQQRLEDARVAHDEAMAQLNKDEDKLERDRQERAELERMKKQEEFRKRELEMKKCFEAAAAKTKSKTAAAKQKTKESLSPTAQEWERQKVEDGAENPAIDSIMSMTGLEEVKRQCLSLKAKVETSIRQGIDLSEERLNIAFLGSPGTGKTTLARHWSKALGSMGLLGDGFHETSGSKLAMEGVATIKKCLEDMLKSGGGTIFIDEAYQLTNGKNPGGEQVLDFLLAEMENHIGKLLFIVAGYPKEMESFFEHNPGLQSRIPYQMKFEDYTDVELLSILQAIIEKKWQGRMTVEGGLHGLFLRIAVRRLGRMRGSPGFGNARACHSLLNRIHSCQSVRLSAERRAGKRSDDFFLSKEDLIGPEPSEVEKSCKAWDQLRNMVGMENVKQEIQSFFLSLAQNYQRELREESPLDIPLNRQFLGPPGTGKTTVAKLYGQILVQLGLLSNGEVVVKIPADFIDSVVGGSEDKTKRILATTVGKVLIIDEAYSLYSSGSDGVGNHSDPFRTAVIDTIVAEVQNVAGEDRCVLLLGYEEQMSKMMKAVNPGLSRRFPASTAFRFTNFTLEQLGQILDKKLRDQDLKVSQEGRKVALKVLESRSHLPNFGNAGEIDNMLGEAKIRFLSTCGSSYSSVILGPEHFDPDHERDQEAGTNLRELFKDVAGCDEVVRKLEGYRRTAEGMKKRGKDPRGTIPTAFVFKGPPGTGKTTTARKIGKFFWNLGFLSSDDVVECSASDLVGQFVGQTGPKTRQKVESAIGKVLFIDEAYRLGDGGFAMEAMDELVDLMTKEKCKGKIIIILAGYEKDINRLLSTNPGLSSRFSEEINFSHLSPQHCLEVLVKELEKEDIILTGDSQPLVSFFKKFSSLDSWGNARDVLTLAKAMVAETYRTTDWKTAPSKIPIQLSTCLQIMRDKFEEMKGRANVGQSRQSATMGPTATLHQDAKPPSFNTSTRTKTQEAPVKPPETKEAPGEVDPKVAEESPGEQKDDGRDAGVSDEIWAQLLADKAAAARKEEEAKRESMEHYQLLLDLAVAGKHKEDKEEKERLERRKKELEEALQRRLKEEAEEKKARQKLESMGICPAGYVWIKQNGGYRCAGGAHFVPNSQLGELRSRSGCSVD